MSRLLLLLTIILATSCATIPSQAPQLSEELGNKINSLEKSHINLLHLYFDQKRSIVDNFINTVWVPEFTENFFSSAPMQDAWSEIIKSNDTKDRLDFFITVGSKLQIVIDQKRQELITPLNDLEKQTESAIREEFNLARSANNTLTSFLTTAAKIDENRQRYQKMLNISDDKISAVINETDDILNTLVTKSTEVLSKEAELKEYKAKADEYLAKMKALKDKVIK